MMDLVLLFIGSIVAATISGAVGFGGALLLLPLLTRTVGPDVGVPLLTVAQLVGNSSRAVLGLRQIAWRPALTFSALAVPMSIVGSYCFVSLPRAFVTRTIGVALLLFVFAIRRGLPRFATRRGSLAGAGALIGFLSGLVGSAGPLGAAVFLSLDLAPGAYIATEATSAVAMHATKLTVYGQFIHLDGHARAIAGLLSVGMVVGSWLGKKSVERLSLERFRLVIGALLVALALQMVVFG